MQILKTLCSIYCLFKEPKWLGSYWTSIRRLSQTYTPTNISFNSGSTLLSTGLGTLQADRIKDTLDNLDQFERVRYGITDNLASILWNNTKVF